MSRVAKLPITLPSTVTLTIQDGKVTIKGPKGCMSHDLNRLVLITKSDESTPQLTFKPASNDPMAWAQAGTARAIISNMVNGVTEGYRAQAKENSVSLALGFSHPIEYLLPAGVTAETPNVTTIILKGIDKQRVGQVASEIRAFRPPEPYKGKGVKYAGEVIVRKEAKKK